MILKMPLRYLEPWQEAFLGLIWPPACAACGQALPASSQALCQRCHITWPRITGHRCEVCSQPFPGGSEAFICESCRDRQFHFVASVSVLQAVGPVREMVHRLKYGGERWLARPLAGWMAENALDPRLPLGEIAALVPVPLHPLREREREFNQAQLLARELSRLWKKPVRSLLVRRRYTETQTHFDRRHRLQNLSGAFTLRGRPQIGGQKFLLVDDVFTTGSTLNECARVLLEAGSGPVWAITAARA